MTVIWKDYRIDSKTLNSLLKTTPTLTLPAQREGLEQVRRLEEAVITTLPALAAEEEPTGRTLPAQKEALVQVLTTEEEEDTILIVQEAAEIQDIIAVEEDIAEGADTEGKISQLFLFYKEGEVKTSLSLNRNTIVSVSDIGIKYKL